MEDVLVKRHHALVDKFSVQDGRRFYASRKCAQPMGVSEAPIAVCHPPRTGCAASNTVGFRMPGVRVIWCPGALGWGPAIPGLALR